jgi:hypothetical protein
LIVPALALIAIQTSLTPVDGLLLSGWLIIVAFGAFELVAPHSVIKWRQWMMEGDPQRQQLGASIDKLLGTSDPTSQAATRNVRIIGVTLLSVGTLLMGLLWLSLHTAHMA